MQPGTCLSVSLPGYNMGGYFPQIALIGLIIHPWSLHTMVDGVTLKLQQFWMEGIPSKLVRIEDCVLDIKYFYLIDVAILWWWSRS